jgi:hypothetical protein
MLVHKMISLLRLAEGLWRNVQGFVDLCPFAKIVPLSSAQCIPSLQADCINNF